MPILTHQQIENNMSLVLIYKSPEILYAQRTLAFASQNLSLCEMSRGFPTHLKKHLHPQIQASVDFPH